MSTQIFQSATVTKVINRPTRSGGPYAFARNCSGDVYINLPTFRRILRGKNGQPFFSSCGDITSLPEVGTQIHFVRREEDFGMPSTPVLFWGLESDWQKATTTATAKIYRVVVLENRFNGQPVTRSAEEEVVAEGTVEELSYQYPYGVANDPLGTVYQSGPCSRLNSWQERRDGLWVSCADPRRFI